MVSVHPSSLIGAKTDIKTAAAEYLPDPDKLFNAGLEASQRCAMEFSRASGWARCKNAEDHKGLIRS